MKNCVAMILAGGQGTRLYALTSVVAKPAVAFGSKYRIIDFTISNCTNSGIDTVGVLTQYQPMILNEYLGNGEPWDLDRSHGGLHVLPPYLAKSGGEWYKGTANAVYQNISFLDAYDSKNVLILSGDHIYRMDYSRMLAHHEAKNADCTIAVIDVPMEEAKRFGIMDFDSDYRITDFAEKPQQPKSNHASMGIYIFKKERLIEELKKEEAKPGTNYDFGKDVIPAMISAGARMYAYPFSGYWKDVGTLKSLWEANMDILNGTLDLSDGAKIYSRNRAYPPTFFGDKADVIKSVLTTGCEVHGKVKNSVISEGVTIGEGAVVENSVILKNVKIGAGAKLNYAIVDEDVVIGKKAKIGDGKEGADKLALIGRGCVVEDGKEIKAGEIVEK